MHDAQNFLNADLHDAQNFKGVIPHDTQNLLPGMSLEA